VSPEVFRERYLQSPQGYFHRHDRNHPAQLQLQTINLETFPLHRIDDPAWVNWTNQYAAIFQMMRDAGREVCVYGIDGAPAEYRAYFNTSRLLYTNNKFALPHSKVFLDKEPEIIRTVTAITQRFKHLTHVNVLSGYAPYRITDVNSHEFRSFIYFLDRKCLLRKAIDPNKPIMLFLQPNSTQDGFKPLGKEVWWGLVEWAIASPLVDRIAVFTLSKLDGMPVAQARGWEEVFRRF